MFDVLIYYFIIIGVWLVSLIYFDRFFREISLIVSFIVLLWSVYLLYLFNYYVLLFDDSILLYQFSLWNFKYQCQLDSISILFVILSNLLLMLCILVSWI